MARRYLTDADLERMRTAHAGTGTSRPQSPTTSDGAQYTARTTGGSAEPVHSITTTPEPHSTDMSRRMKVYGVQMALRVACFFGFVLVDNWWLRIACVIGMVLLPWSAVLLANAGADRSERSSNYLGAGPSSDLNPELPAPSSHHPSQGQAEDMDEPATWDGDDERTCQDHEVVEGEWADGAHSSTASVGPDR